MATTIAINRFQPIFERNRNHGATPMTPKRDLQPIIYKIRQLQELTQTTGFKTTRSQGALLADLTPDELCEVNEALKNVPKQ